MPSYQTVAAVDVFVGVHSAHTPALSQEAIKDRDASDDAPERKLAWSPSST
jgi:hypothetical protein